MVEPYHALNKNHLCTSGTGIAYVKTDEPFHILIAHFGEHDI